MLMVAATVIPATAAPAAGPSVTPPGMTTLIENAAWSWFEDARVAFTADGTRLTTSAVVGTASTTPAPGTVALAELDLADGARRLVDLGRGEPDDHNSASIYEASTGEVTTAWSRHHKDNLVRTQRRRTDGSWLRLPPVDVGRRTTYNNLRLAADASGNPVLYDFIRGERFDPEVIASADLGRTWIRLGRVLRDPEDDVNTRPYVQYSQARDGRIDLFATEAHPSKVQTSVYHGYIEAGLVHDSAGTVLGTLGSAVPVTSLTRVWAPTGAERAWTSDIVSDPVSGSPTVVFSVRHTDADHRYWYGRWNGTAWQIEEIAFAGRALYAAEGHYTGLVALDPSDTRHVVLSADVSPVDGAPLVSAADGRRHWELWDGHRTIGGTWSWTPLTAHSAVDNLRPELASDPTGASALLWLRGTYTNYLAHDLDVVGVVRSGGGAPVVAGPGTWSPAVDVLAMPPPRSQRARPVVGRFDGHPAVDLLMVRAGAAPEDLFLGDDQRHPTPIATPSVDSTAVPVAGDFDANGRTDIFWYAPGAGPESLWSTSGLATFTRSRPQPVVGSYTPIPGDYDGDGRTDIYWYAPGATTDRLWTATTAGTFTTTNPQQVLGTYTPIPGDHDGDGRTDIHWYAPGARDYLWWSDAAPLDRSEPAALDA